MRPAMPGICVAVKATTSVFGSPRKATLKLWKSRPPAPMMIVLRIALLLSAGRFSVDSGGSPLPELRRLPLRKLGAVEEGPVRIAPGLGRLLLPLTPLHPDEDRDSEEQEHEALRRPPGWPADWDCWGCEGHRPSSQQGSAFGFTRWKGRLIGSGRGSSFVRGAWISSVPGR